MFCPQHIAYSSEWPKAKIASEAKIHPCLILCIVNHFGDIPNDLIIFKLDLDYSESSLKLFSYSSITFIDPPIDFFSY